MILRILHWFRIKKVRQFFYVIAIATKLDNNEQISRFYSLKFIYMYKLQTWYREPSFVRIYRKFPSIWKTTQKIRSIQLKMCRGSDVPKF